MKLVKRWFRGGPLDGTSLYVSAHATEFILATEASLEAQLAASLKLAQGTLTAVPTGRALYRLNGYHEFELKSLEDR